MPSPYVPAGSSPFYETLHATALEFIRSQDLDPSQPSRINQSRIKAVRSSTNFQHSWGHNYFVSTKPNLSGVVDADGFIKHLNNMTPHLESWDIKITDVMVDETRQMACVRASYFMEAKGIGEQEKVENDLIWWLQMEEDGKKVEKAVEFIDGVASMKLMEVMKSMKK